MLIEEDAQDGDRLWQNWRAIRPCNGWAGPAVTHIALAAMTHCAVGSARQAGRIAVVEVARWRRRRSRARNTDIGWLSIPGQAGRGKPALIEQGFRRLKLKVGHADP